MISGEQERINRLRIQRRFTYGRNRATHQSDMRHSGVPTVQRPSGYIPAGSKVGASPTCIINDIFKCVTLRYKPNPNLTTRTTRS